MWKPENRKTGYFKSKNRNTDLKTDQKRKAENRTVPHDRNFRKILRRQTKKVSMEKEALDEAAKQLEHVHFSTVLKLNVGGQLFSTTLATLNNDAGIFRYVWNWYLYHKMSCRSYSFDGGNIFEVSSFTKQKST